MGQLRAVLFDLDDTLVDHTGASTSALRAWIPTLGVDERDVEPLMHLWADLEQRHWPLWRAGEISFQEQRRRRLRDFLPAAGHEVDEQRLDTIFDGYLAGYEQHWVAFDDAAPALTHAGSAGLRIGVLTNGEQERQTLKLVYTKLIDLCGQVFASSSLPLGKPHPEAYQEACRRLGVAPNEALMVGDNYELDVQAARAAGLSAIHLNRAGKPSTTDTFITTLRDLQLLR